MISTTFVSVMPQSAYDSRSKKWTTTYPDLDQEIEVTFIIRDSDNSDGSSFDEVRAKPRIRLRDVLEAKNETVVWDSDAIKTVLAIQNNPLLKPQADKLLAQVPELVKRQAAAIRNKHEHIVAIQ